MPHPPCLVIMFLYIYICGVHTNPLWVINYMAIVVFDTLTICGDEYIVDDTRWVMLVC